MSQHGAERRRHRASPRLRPSVLEPQPIVISLAAGRDILQDIFSIESCSPGRRAAYSSHQDCWISRLLGTDVEADIASIECCGDSAATKG